MADLSPYQIEQKLRKQVNELGQVRERLNSRASDYQKATAEYKAEYAKHFLTAKVGGKTVKEAEIRAQQETAELEATYKVAEQLVLNERKAVDALLAQVDITRSLYSRACKEMEQYHRREN